MSKAKKKKTGQKGDPKAEFTQVTPQMAKDWLRHAEANIDNRRIDMARVRQWASAMSAGDWRSNGESIKFDTKNCLLDGQHRLAAIVLSGVSVPMMVVRDVATECIYTMDTGKPRSLADSLHMDGYPRAAKLAAAINYAMCFESERPVIARGERFTLLEQRRWLDENADIEPTLDQAHELKLQGTLGHETMIAGFYYVAWKQDANLADKFIQDLATGADLPVDANIYKLRERLLADRRRTKGHRESYQVVMALLMKVWRAEVAGEQLGRIRIGHDDLRAGMTDRDTNGRAR